MLSICRNLRVISFRGLFQNGRAEATCLSASRAYVIQNKCAYPNTTPKNYLILSGSNPLRECVRFKSKDKNKGARRVEYESDSDDEDEDSNFDFDGDGRPLIVKKSLTSVRLDCILMRVFGFTRRKTDDLLMANYVYVNDAVAIKSYEVKPEDVVEIKELLEPTSSTKGTPQKIEIVKVQPDLVSHTFSVAYVIC